MKRILSAVAAALVSFAAPNHAETLTATIDPAKAQVAWLLGGSLHETHGTFHLKEGKISLDFEKKTMAGLVVIDAKSGESGNDSRDHKMHTEVLNSDKYPEIRFTPASWQGDLAMTGSSKVQVSGVLEVHGAKHDVTMPMELKLDQGHFTGTARFDVPYVQWGMKDPSNFLLKVEKKVVIQVTAEGQFAH